MGPGGLVVAAWVEGEAAQELAGGGVDDADVQVLHEHQDVGSGVGPADAEVVEPAAVAQGDGATAVSIRARIAATPSALRPCRCRCTSPGC